MDFFAECEMNPVKIYIFLVRENIKKNNYKVIIGMDMNNKKDIKVGKEIYIRIAVEANISDWSEESIEIKPLEINICKNFLGIKKLFF